MVLAWGSSSGYRVGGFVTKDTASQTPAVERKLFCSGQEASTGTALGTSHLSSPIAVKGMLGVGTVSASTGGQQSESRKLWPQKYNIWVTCVSQVPLSAGLQMRVGLHWWVLTQPRVGASLGAPVSRRHLSLRVEHMAR